MNIQPVGLSIKEWCDYMVDELIQFGQAPQLIEEKDWQEWGSRVCAMPGVAAFNPPNSILFDNFYDWAERFNLTVSL